MRSPPHHHLAVAATRAALRLRMSLGGRLDEPVAAFDAAEQAGMHIRFANLSSAEALYSRGNHTAVINTNRPHGRRAQNAAHELGHHVFGHGTQVDELVEKRSAEDRFEPNEYIANRFATAFLMPQAAVDRAFTARGLQAATSSAESVFEIAQFLGVGFVSLVNYLENTLHYIAPAKATELRGAAPKALRSMILGCSAPNEVFVVDEHWAGRPLDMEVGDAAVVRGAFTLDGKSATVGPGPSLVVATTPGTTRLILWRTKTIVEVRVCRKGFTGVNEYRFLPLEDEDDE